VTFVWRLVRKLRELIGIDLALNGCGRGQNELNDEGGRAGEPVA
jgi:hypothetical protein